MSTATKAAQCFQYCDMGMCELARIERGTT
jgi:hypothetical protein